MLLQTTPAPPEPFSEATSVVGLETDTMYGDLKISIIAAMDRNRLIGSNNRLPWIIPEDLAWFKDKTLGHTVIMGKKTWQSLGRTLQGRTNVILTRDRHYSIPGALVCNDPEEVLQFCKDEECFVIGGAQLFRLFLPWSSRLYLTRIDAEFSGDTWFPEIDFEAWETTFFETVRSVTGYRLDFTVLVRK